MAEIQRRQAEVQKLQAEEMSSLREMFREGMSNHEKRMAHIEQNLDEASDKLNGLIGYLDDRDHGKRP